MNKLFATSLLSLAMPMLVLAQTNNVKEPTKEAPKKKAWYETFQIRGYNQIRYNRLLETNDKYKSEQGDRSIGANGGFMIRRSRVIIQGNVGEHVFLYIQPDFANTLSGTTNTHYVQLRDCYFDVGLDKKNEFRIRFGQSKVPYGYENLQSSQNRLPLDRNDALNSAVSNERDLGVAFYWAPKKIRERFAHLVNDGLKGSGDYGVFGLMVYNGQVANKLDANNSPHVVARLTYPFDIKGQIVEPSIQAYKGKYVLSDLTSGVKKVSNLNYLDSRVAGTLSIAPQPFGLLAEYTVGQGPEYNKETDSIETRNLKGGFATFFYKTNVGKDVIIPFYRTQYYQGGKKHEKDARSYGVTENEIGAEWQVSKNFEFTAMYTIGAKRWEDKGAKNNERGNLLRLQAQVNF